MRIIPNSFIIAAGGLAACASDPNLEPARPSQAVTDDAARVTVDDVEVVAVADAWNGAPLDLAERVTPIRLRVQNESRAPIALRYEHLHLETSKNSESHPVPPQSIEGEAPAAEPVAPRYASRAFSVASYYGTVYRGATPTQNHAPYDPQGYYRGYRDYWTETLPTKEMIARALPEGVLEPSGYVDGFVYFEHFEADDVTGPVTLEVRVTNAQTGETAAVIRVPFVVARSSGG